MPNFNQHLRHYWKMNVIKLFVALLAYSSAFAQTIYLPNIKSTLSGTLDAGLASSNVHITGVSAPGLTVGQGNKGTIPQSWYVQPCDGTNCQNFTAGGEGLVTATQSGVWSVGRTWTILNSTDSVSSWTFDGSGNPISSTGGALNVNVTTPISVSNPSIGVNGSANPSDSTQVGGVDPSGNLQPINITASGAVKTDSSATTQPISVASLPLPSNAAQETGGNLAAIATHQTDGTQQAKITDGTNSVTVKSLNNQVVSTDYGLVTNSIIHGLTTGGGGGYVDVKVNPSGALTVDATVSSSVLPTGAATSSNQSTEITSLSSIDSKLGTLGQKTMAGSAPVVIASDQSAIPVTGSITATNPSVGTNGSAAPASSTQIGASDGVNLQPLQVDGSNNLKVNVQSSVLATGAATSANQTTANTSLSSIDGKLNSLGQKTMAGSAPVVIASDQSAIPVTLSGGGATKYQHSQLFTSNGSWVAPASTTSVLLIGAPGGGGGGGGAGGSGTGACGTAGSSGSPGASGSNTTFLNSGVGFTFSANTSGGSGATAPGSNAGAPTVRGGNAPTLISNSGTSAYPAELFVSGYGDLPYMENRLSGIGGSGGSPGSAGGGCTGSVGSAGGAGGFAVSSSAEISVTPTLTYTVTIGDGGNGGTGGAGGSQSGAGGAGGSGGTGNQSATPISSPYPVFVSGSSIPTEYNGSTGATGSGTSGQSGGGGGGGKGAKGFLLVLWNQ